VPLTALALALAAAFVHALWNLLLARARDIEAATAVALVVAVAAFAFPAASFWHADGRVWPYLVGSAAFELVYFALLAAAYRRAEFSVVYPIARGSAPVLVLVVAVAGLHASTSWQQAAGVALVGVIGLSITALALVGRWATLLPWGFVGVGASYAAFLSLRPGAVDARAPAVAAAFFIAAELSFWSIERRSWRSEREVIVRRLALIASAGLATAIVGGLLLLLTSGRRIGIGEEAAGVVAAVLTLAVVAFLARRSRDSAPT
jgi:multidrug transporter EmrE-like cation transporter